MPTIARLTRNLVALLMFASASAFAVPITFIHSGSGSGSIDGNLFTSAAFTITASDDTLLRQDCGAGCYFIDSNSASIDIDGVGTFAFLTGTRTFVQAGSGVVGFSRSGDGGLDLFNGPTNGALLGYDLTTAIGPVGGSGEILQWTAGDVLTSGGVLVFDDAIVDATFTAVLVPEPETYALILAGLGVLAFVARRRKI